MTMEFIQTPNAPAAIGPYSQAVACGDWLFCSGQIAIDPESDAIVGETAAEQAARVLLNLGSVLEAGGCSLDRVVKTTIYLRDMNDFGAVNEVYAEAFGAHRPARATVEVARLPKDVLVEMDAIARRGS